MVQNPSYDLIIVGAEWQAVFWPLESRKMG